MPKPPRPRHSHEQKLAAVEYARKHTGRMAAKEWKVSEKTIRNWIVWADAPLKDRPPDDLTPSEDNGSPVDVGRLKQVRAHMARAWAPSRLAQVLAADWGVTPKEVQGYIQRARDQLALEGAARMDYNFPLLYQEHRERIAGIHAAAMGQKTTKMMGSGDTRREVTFSDPDFGNALKAAIYMAKLDGFFTDKLQDVVTDRILLSMTAAGKSDDSQDDAEYRAQVDAVLEAQYVKRLRALGWKPPTKRVVEGRVIDVTPELEETG